MKATSSLCLLQFHFTSLIWWAESELTSIVAAQPATYHNRKGKLLRDRVQEVASRCADAKGWWIWMVTELQWCWCSSPFISRSVKESVGEKLRNSPLGIAAILYVCTVLLAAQSKDKTGTDWHWSTCTHTHTHLYSQSLPEYVLFWPSGSFW